MMKSQLTSEVVSDTDPFSVFFLEGCWYRRYSHLIWKHVEDHKADACVLFAQFWPSAAHPDTQAYSSQSTFIRSTSGLEEPQAWLIYSLHT